MNYFKVAASDFDGTLFREMKISAEDMTAIKSWQAAGNKFGIVTGRCYPMLTSRIKDFDLEIDQDSYIEDYLDNYIHKVAFAFLAFHN